MVKLFRAFRHNKLTKDDILKVLHQLVVNIDRSFSALSSDFQKIWKSHTEPILTDCLRTFDTLTEIEHTFTNTIADLVDQMTRMKETDQLRVVIHQVKAYMDQNYTNIHLSLDYLSDKFGLNGRYLSKVFKETFGVKFIDYLNMFHLFFS